MLKLQELVKIQLQLSLSVAARFHPTTKKFWLRFGKTADKWNMYTSWNYLSTLCSQYFKTQRCRFHSYKIYNYSSGQEISRFHGNWWSITTTFIKARNLNLSCTISVYIGIKRHSKSGKKYLPLFGNIPFWTRGVHGFWLQEFICYCRKLQGARQREGVEDTKHWITLATSWILHSSVVRWAN